MGACATGGGRFKEGYNVGVGHRPFLPVDVYVPGCPPTPEGLMCAYMAVHEKIQQENIKAVRWYQKDPIPEVPVPLLGGPDLVDPRQIPEISAAAREPHLETASDGAGPTAEAV